MRWFVYPELVPAETRCCRGPSGLNWFTVIPPVNSFLGTLLGQFEQTPDPGEASYLLIPAVLDIPPHRSFSAELEAALARYLGSFPRFLEFPERHVIFLLGDGAGSSGVPGRRRVHAELLTKVRGPTAVLLRGTSRDCPHRDRKSGIRCQLSGHDQDGVRAAVTNCRRPSSVQDAASLLPGHRRLLPRNLQPGTAAGLASRIPRPHGAKPFRFLPSGDGLNSLRFFETLALGRLPVLVAN